MTKKTRILAGLVILALLLTLCAYYAAEYENNLKHPSYRAILTDYPEGEVVYVHGTVTSNYPGGYQIQENYHDQLVTMQVHSDAPMAVGDDVSLLGVLGPDYQITKIQKVDVNEKWQYHFLLLRSFLALLFLFYILHRYWYFDREEFLFRRR